MSPRPGAFRVVFVCTGNICRSPMADVVFQHLADQAGLGDRVVSSSAGTGDWHVGERADERTIEALRGRGYDGAKHRAKQLTADDLSRSDLVVALDRSHERILQNWAASEEERDRIALLLSFDPSASGTIDVPDPYYADQQMFDDVLTTVESATTALFHQLEPALRAGVR